MDDWTLDQCANSPIVNDPAILDIHSDALVVRTRLRAILVGVGVGMAAVIVVGICAGLLAALGAGSTVAWSFTAICGGGVFAAFWARHRMWCNEFSTAIGALAGPTHSLVSQAVEMLRFRPANDGLSMLGAELVSRGTLGVTIRIAAESDCTSIGPLQVAVEPFSLDESDDRFLQLALTGSERAGRAAEKDLERDVDSRRLRRVGPLAILCIPMLFVVGADIRSWLLTGSWNPKDVLMLTIVGVCVFQAGWQHYANYARHFAVNGGLLYRPRWPRDGFHLFTRERGVLILYKDNQRKWHWIFCDETCPGGIDMACTASEGEMLLRAWLSLLPPPEVERLSDFQ